MKYLKKVQILILLLAIGMVNCEGQFHSDEDCEDDDGNFRMNRSSNVRGMNGRYNVNIEVMYLKKF